MSLASFDNANFVTVLQQTSSSLYSRPSFNRKSFNNFFLTFTETSWMRHVQIYRKHRISLGIGYCCVSKLQDTSDFVFFLNYFYLRKNDDRSIDCSFLRVICSARRRCLSGFFPIILYFSIMFFFILFFTQVFGIPLQRYWIAQ